MQEIRIEISSDITGADTSLLVNVVKSPIPGLAGTRNNVQVSMSRAELIKLRSKPAQLDLQFLRNLGEQIQKNLGPNIWPVIQASRQAKPEETFRIVIIVHDSAIRPLGQSLVQPDEIPIELIRDLNNDFYALNYRTPIVRGVSIDPDRPTKNIIVPLKILIVVSTPSDKPPSSIDKEKKVIQQSLQNYLADENTGSEGKILIRWCIPATKMAFDHMLTDFNPHVVHFIGHGGFDTNQEGGVSQGYLCFEQEDNDSSDPMTADDLAVLLRNTSSPVGLFVLTSCSSAQPKDEFEEEEGYNTYLNKGYNPFAFEGVAQKLVAGTSGVTAAVAMQFDIEDVAAVEFTRTFYEQLFKPNITIEEVVTRARIAIVRRMTIAHPAWINPVLFTRSIDGIIFNIQTPVGELTPQEKSELAELDRELRSYHYAADQSREMISTIPPDMQDMVRPQLTDFLNKIEQVELQRSQILGDSVRIHGIRTRKNLDIELPVSLHIRIPTNVDRIQFDVQYPADVLLNAQVGAGKDTPTITPALARQDINTISVMLVWPPGNSTQFNTGEFEIAKLVFHVSPTASSGFSEISIRNIGIYHNNSLVGNRGMSQALFVED
ncbi:MAG TPA: CHAT domain-containing protein [Nitrososphaeraceae archaeon]|nr:CHAT domain-containing protein [Nitrososphaeraceae archaeon]